MESKNRKTNFLKVHCAKCKGEQVIFARPVSQVNCLVCNEPLTGKPTGGRAELTAQIVEVI